MTASETLAETRRKDIMRAALQCFAAKGFYATTMADIARAAKMSAGNLYNYFEGKVDIVEALARYQIEHMKKTLDELQEGLCTQEAIKEHIRTIVLARLDSLAAKISLEILSECTRNERLAKVLHTFDAQWREALLEVTKKRCDEPESRIFRRIEMNLALMDGLGARLVSHPDLDRKALSDDIADFIASQY